FQGVKFLGWSTNFPLFYRENPPINSLCSHLKIYTLSSKRKQKDQNTRDELKNMPKQLKINQSLGKAGIRGKLKFFCRSLFSLAFIFLLSACQPFDVLNPKGRIAANEKEILWISLILMLLIVVPVILLTLAFAWRYRAGNSDAKYQPHW